MFRSALLRRSASLARASAARGLCAAPEPAALTSLEPLGEVAKATRVLRLCKPPVNSMSLEMLTSITDSLAEAEADESCRAVIIASAQKVFSAGLDITEMHQPDRERLRDFWYAVQEVWLRTSTSRLATVAAIEGHSPAGGCLLALSCDWRVMSLADPTSRPPKPFTIGLNETKLGIVAPFWFADSYRYVIGARQADHLLQTGALVTTEQAAAIGLVDEAVEHEQVMGRAVAKVKELLAVPDLARHASKMLTRGPMAERLVEARDEDIVRPRAARTPRRPPSRAGPRASARAHPRARGRAPQANFENFVFQDAVQNSLTKYMEALKARPKK